jgi:hypothetical protein
MLEGGWQFALYVDDSAGDEADRHVPPGNSTLTSPAATARPTLLLAIRT